MMTNSSWLETFQKKVNPFTNRYTLDQFISALKSGDLLKTVGWG
jgi:hypothetical protein